MKKQLLTTLAMCALAATAMAEDAPARWTLNAAKPEKGITVQPTMYGIFFEDINFGADGGLYAEMVENRSFEFPQALMGWNTFGNVTVNTANPAFKNNPHYVTLKDPGHRDKRTGLENHGFFGMGVKKGMVYNFSVEARLADKGAKAGKIRVELINKDNDIVAKSRLDIISTEWKKHTVTITSPITAKDAFMRVYLESKDGVDLDHISLFPSDAWKGAIRTDMLQALKDLQPGVFRFPGGCIVEGTDLASRYQWKNTVGKVEERPLNENRWNYTFPHRLYPNYYQTGGLGFYEYFLISEHIGATPLPILNVGMACQYQNKGNEAKANVPLEELDPYIQDALDLIEFANGTTDTKWGRLREEMGHPEPFNLQFLGIGNEQWDEAYPQRLEPFIKAIKAKYPKMNIIGSSGPDPSGERFDYGWKRMRDLNVELVDEHYYRDENWFRDNIKRYDKYPRKGPKVFAGEYACHTKKVEGKEPTRQNNFLSALHEAAFMTGMERNADVVHMTAYAPLFAHVDGWQWRPDLIWVDNLETVLTPNYYVQQLYSTNPGTNVLPLTAGKLPVAGEDGLYASATYDKRTKEYILKIANLNDAARDVAIEVKGLKNIGAQTVTTLRSDNPKAINTIAKKDAVKPVTTTVAAQTGNILKLSVPARSFAVYKFGK